MKKLWTLKESYPEGFSCYVTFDDHDELVDYLADAQMDQSTKLELRSHFWEQADVEKI